MSKFGKMSPENREKIKTKLFMQPINSVDQYVNWVDLFLGLRLPDTSVEDGHVSVAESLYEIYRLVIDKEAHKCPQVALLASRDSFKTMGATVLIFTLFIHGQLPIANAGAIRAQAYKASSYLSNYFRKCDKYLTTNGWIKESDNKQRLEWITPSGESIYIAVLAGTKTSMNSEHVPFLCLDEIDLFDAEAYKEATMIPSVYKGYFPITVYLSTRKYAGGLMQSTLDRVNKIGKVYKWNIIDVAERITHEEARIDEPRVKRYIATEMPLRNVSPDEYDRLNEKEQQKYEMIMAYAGIAEHELLPAMKNMLVDRSQEDHGNLYKPVVAVLNNFLGTEPDMAEAQLLCHEPSRAGLIYSRFSNTENVISIEQAYEDLMGVAPRDNFGYWDFIDILNKAGVPMICSIDWGWTDYTSVCVTAIMPNKQAIVIYNDFADKMAINEIEIKLKAVMNDFKNIEVIYGDSAYPAYIDHFKSVIMPDGSKMPMIGVIKGRDSVLDGITTVQNLIVNASNERLLQILKCEQNAKIIESFGIYKWQQDQSGEPIEGKPSHSGWVGDVQDSLRYGIYSVFKLGKSLGIRVASDVGHVNDKLAKNNLKNDLSPNETIFKNELNKLVDHDLDQSVKHESKKYKKKKGGVKIV